MWGIVGTKQNRTLANFTRADQERFHYEVTFELNLERANGVLPSSLERGSHAR